MKEITKTLKSDSGTSLLEVLLYIVLAATILGSIMASFTAIIQSRVKNQTIAEVEQQGLLAMQNITQTIRNADSINSPAANTSASSLSLVTYVVGNSPTVFDLSSGALRIKEGAATAVPITSSKVTVSDLTFINTSKSSTPGTIKIQFTITYNNSLGRNEQDYNKTFYGSATIR